MIVQRAPWNGDLELATGVWQMLDTFFWVATWEQWKQIISLALRLLQWDPQSTIKAIQFNFTQFNPIQFNCFAKKSSYFFSTLLTTLTGITSPMMYSIQFLTVDSLNGCISDSSSQKKPRLYGSPSSLKNRIGKPTANGRRIKYH